MLYSPAVDLNALKIFLSVAHERSFSRAAAKVHRTQPAVSQAVRRLEVELGEQLFDRSSKSGTLTDAGRMLQNYGQRLVRLAEETESAVRDLRDLRRGRVLIGANEAAVHTLLPLIVAFPAALSRTSRSTCAVCPARQIAVEVQQGSLDFGALTFQPSEAGTARGAGRNRRARAAGAALAPARQVASRSRWRTSPRNRSSRTTIRRRRVSACCGCSKSITCRCNGGLAAEPRRHQARSRIEARRGAAAARGARSPRSPAADWSRCRSPACRGGGR